MAQYNSLHRQQLFHWIGSHIDARAPDGKLTDSLREEYVDCLRGALQKGLWVKTPRDPDFLGDGTLIKVHRPIAWFTEWGLGQSIPHTARYGRLGLGFPKRFVMSRGGQPVTYVRDSKRNDPYTQALKVIAKDLTSVTPAIATSKLSQLRDYFDYLAHFNKRIRRPSVLKVKKSIGGKKAVKLVTPPDPFTRRYGPTLHFLEEREWRIVHHSSIEVFFTKSKAAAAGPDFYLPFRAGEELFTVVVPDNRTLNMAVNDAKVRKSLYPKSAPHVTILSLQDIGTF